MKLPRKNRPAAARREAAVARLAVVLCLLAATPGPARADRGVEAFFLSGEYRLAITSFRLGEELPPRERFLLALCYREAGELRVAAAILRELVESPEAERATVVLAGCLLRLGETGEADRLLTAYRRDFPTGESMPQALLLQAEAREKMGRTDEAASLLSNLRRAFPFSDEADEANRRMARMAGEFTLQFGNFGDHARAEEVATRLRRNGNDAYLSRLAAEKISYRVRAGNFPSREEAEAAGMTIARATGLDFFVARAR